jgi:chorismate mutase
MTKSQSKKLAMYLAVLRILRNHPALLESAPALEPLIAELDRLAGEIQHTVSRRNNYRRGIALAKAYSRDELVQLAYPVAQAIRAWAGQSGEASLARRFNLTLSDLNQMRQVNLATGAETILAQARAMGSSLEPYGIKAAHLDALALARSRFLELIAEPRAAVVTQRTATATIASLFQEADVLLRERMDPLLNISRGSAAYSDYAGARRLSGERRRTAAPGAVSTASIAVWPDQAVVGWRVW